MERTEYTPAGLATYEGPHRRTYRPEWIEANDDTWLLVQLCEDLVDDYWEPSVIHLWRLERPSPN
jgi:hypothetical protein